MKVVSLAAFLALAACKPDPATKPAPADIPAGQPAAHAHSQAQGGEAKPALPDDTGSDAPAEIEHRSRLDKDGDGVVSPEERAAAKAERAKRMHDRYDTNHDGKLTPDELAAAGGSGLRGPHFDDPAALDTDHDGEISPDELQQGMRDWRMEHRHGAIGGGSGSGE